MQVCNNLVLGVSMAAVAEALALGAKLGLDPKLLSEIFNTSSARCWSSDTYNPCPVNVVAACVIAFTAHSQVCWLNWSFLPSPCICQKGQHYWSAYMLVDMDCIVTSALVLSHVDDIHLYSTPVLAHL